MDAIGKSFEGVGPPHGLTQRWGILLSYLLLKFYFWYQGPPSMATSSRGINDEYLKNQVPIEIWCLYPLFQFYFWGDGKHIPYTVMDAEVWLLVKFWPKIEYSFPPSKSNPSWLTYFVHVQRRQQNKIRFNTIGSDKLDQCSFIHLTC